MASIVKTLGVNRAQVYMAKHRVSQLVKREVMRIDRADDPFTGLT